MCLKIVFWNYYRGPFEVRVLKLFEMVSILESDSTAGPCLRKCLSSCFVINQVALAERRAIWFRGFVESSHAGPRASKGPGKRGHIDSDTLLLRLFLGLRKLGNICCGHKMFLDKIRNISCVPNIKFVSATNVVRGQTGKRLYRQQCVRDNVYSFGRALTLVATPRLHLSFSRAFKVCIMWYGQKRDEKCTSIFRN